MSSCKTDTPIIADDFKPSFFNDYQFDLITHLSERILPKTDTPGAIDAGVHIHLDQYAKDNFTKKEQQLFVKGLNELEEKSQSKYKTKFVDLKPEDQDALLLAMHNHAEAVMKKDPKAKLFYPALKGAVVYSFASSEIGATQFFKYDPVPGKYIGCVDYEEVGGIWAL